MGRSKIIILAMIALFGCSSNEVSINSEPDPGPEYTDSVYCNPLRNWTIVNPLKLASVDQAAGMWSEYVTFSNHGIQIFVDVEDELPEAHWVGAATMMRDVCAITIRTDYMESVGVALHEIGHCIGLWNHSDDPTSIMFHRYNGVETITPDIPAMLEQYDVDRGCSYDEK